MKQVKELRIFTTQLTPQLLKINAILFQNEARSNNEQYVSNSHIKDSPQRLFSLNQTVCVSYEYSFTSMCHLCNHDSLDSPGQVKFSVSGPRSISSTKSLRFSSFPSSCTRSLIICVSTLGPSFPIRLCVCVCCTE